MSNIFELIKAGELKALRVELELDPNKINERHMIKNLTLLHFAAAAGQVTILDFLIQKITKRKSLADFDINVSDDEGNTPLHYALDNNHERAAMCLLMNGAEVGIENYDKKSSKALITLYNIHKSVNDEIELFDSLKISLENTCLADNNKVLSFRNEKTLMFYPSSKLKSRSFEQIIDDQKNVNKNSINLSSLIRS